MENETEIIFSEQLKKLPAEVVTFILSSNWNTDIEEIGSLFNLTEKDASLFMREISLVLAGLIHPDEFSFTLEELGFKGVVLESLVENVEKKIFAPIRPALIEFFEKEARENTEEAPIATASQSVVSGQMSNVLRRPDVAPKNLPTEEGTESFLPPIPLKFGAEGVSAPVHPFEEKMKKVFTAGQQSLGDLAIEPPSQTPSLTQAPKAPPIYHADPYREAIE